MNLISSSVSPPSSSLASIPARLAQAGIAIRNPSDKNELENAIKELGSLNAAQKEKIAKLKSQVQAKQHKAKVRETEKKQRKELKADVIAAKKSLIAQESSLAQIKNMFNEMKKTLECPQCKTTNALPKVIGLCGHIVCQDCLDIPEETETKGLHADAAKKHPAINKCSLCASSVLGQGFPVEALTILMSHLSLNTKVEHPFIESPANIQMMAAYADKEAGKSAFLNLKLPPLSDDMWRQGIVFQFPFKCPSALIEGFKSALTEFFTHDLQKINLWTRVEGFSFIANVYSHGEVIQSSPKKGKIIKIDPYDFFAKNYPSEPLGK